ncbi:hypothetical protein J2X34_004518, partial [Rhodococcus sp. BE178]
DDPCLLWDTDPDAWDRARDALIDRQIEVTE